MNFCRIFNIVAFAAAFILIGATAADAAWVVSECPQQPGWSGDTALVKVNDSGVACGYADYVSGISSVAILYDGETVTELPFLDPAPINYPFGLASDINSGGQVAGRSHDAKGVDRAVIWDNGSITLIPFPADANTNSDMRAYGLNDAGVTVGYYSSTTTGQPAAFYYDGTVHSLVPALDAIGLSTNGTQSYADDVNNNGLICGEAKDSSGYYNFYTYDIGTGIATNLGRMYIFESCHASGINDAGSVIGRGRSYLGSPIHALLNNGVFNIIDDTVTDAQWAYSINNAGRVVGSSGSGAVRWSWFSSSPGSGSMVPINLPGWSAISVEGVNEHDLMAGYGPTTASPDDDRAFILSPPPADANHNGSVDLDDLASFVACLSGPIGAAGFAAPSQACLDAFDLLPEDTTGYAIEIPPYPGWTGNMEAYGINDSGEVCGNGNYVVNTSSTPFRYSGGAVTPLPILAGADKPIALARAINSSGVICGYSRNSVGLSAAVYWDGTSITALPFPPDLATNRDFRAYAINDNDIIVGYFYDTSLTKRAFYYDRSSGTSYSLNTAIQAAGLTGWSSAENVNNLNVICGSATNAMGITMPWTYDIGTGTVTVLSAISAEGTSAADINDSGNLIGTGKLNIVDSDRVLFYDTEWHVVDSDVNATQYTGAINDIGRIVGSTYIGSSNRSSWHSDGPGAGSMTTLNMPGWDSVTATGINNDNWISGYGESPTAGGQIRAFIYKPLPGDGDVDLEDFAAFQRVFEGQ